MTNPLRQPYPVTVEIAPEQALWAGATYQAPYYNIGGRRRASTTNIELEYGRSDEAADVEAASGSATFDDRDGDLSPYNPLGTWYEQLDSNVPARMRMPDVWTDDFTRTTSNGWGSSPDGYAWSNTNAALSTNGTTALATIAAANVAYSQILVGAGSPDMEIRASFSVSATPLTEDLVTAITFRRESNDDCSHLYLRWKPDGTLRWQLRTVVGGSLTTIDFVDTLLPFTPNAEAHVRVQVEGPLVRGRVWTGDRVADEGIVWDFQWEAETEAPDGTGVGLLMWRLLGETTVGAITLRCHYFEVDAILFSGSGYDLPPTWDKSGVDSPTVITFAGALRELQARTDQEPLRSAMYRQLLGYINDFEIGGVVFTPCEDGSESTFATSALPGGSPTTNQGVVFGDTDTPGGVEACAAYETATASLFVKGNTSSEQEFAAMILLKLPGGVTTQTVLHEWTCDAGTVRRWQICLNQNGAAGRIVVIGKNSAGTNVFTSSEVNIIIEKTNWFAMQLEVVENLGNVGWTLLWTEIGVNVFWFTDGSFAGTLAGCRGIKMNATAELVGMKFAMIWIGGEELPFVTPGFSEVAEGYPGELAADRIDRLCFEEGIPLVRQPGVSSRMGVQKPNTFLELLREAAKADAGLLFERGRGLGYAPHGARENPGLDANPTMTIEWSRAVPGVPDSEGGQLAAAPVPSGDDQRYASRFTAKRTNGGEATDEADATTVARRGLVKAGDEYNLYVDTQLPDRASWEVFQRSWLELRWPTIEIDLMAHPELIDQWLRCKVGSRIAVVNPKEQVLGQEIDLIIEGIRQEVGLYTWKVTLTCSPAKVFDVAVYGSTRRLLSSRTSYLDGFYDDTDTVIDVSFDEPSHGWSQTAADFPILIQGEEMLVTSVGPITGSGPYTQSFTVTRAVNGVLRTVLLQFKPVQIHPRVQARYALPS